MKKWSLQSAMWKINTDGFTVLLFMATQLFASEFHYFEIKISTQNQILVLSVFWKKSLNYLKTKKAMNAKFVKGFGSYSYKSNYLSIVYLNLHMFIVLYDYKLFSQMPFRCNKLIVFFFLTRLLCSFAQTVLAKIY